MRLKRLNYQRFFSSIILIVAYVAVASIMSLGGYLLVYEIDLMGIFSRYQLVTALSSLRSFIFRSNYEHFKNH